MKRNTSWTSLVAVVGIALLAVVVGGPSPNALADPQGFAFTPLVFLGDPAPGGGTFFGVFDSNMINNRGDVLFGSNLTSEADFGVFLLRKGVISEIARTGEPAPGGGVFVSPGDLAPLSLNDEGDAGFAFLLSPFTFPAGVNAGVYRFSSATGTVTPVVIPGVTPAPGGGVFAGSHFGVSLNNRGDLVFPGIVPTDKGIHLPDEPYVGLGVGLFKANKKGQISSVVSPGDPAPGGGTFDFAAIPWINDGGDVAFAGHVAGEECRAEGFPPQAIFIQCLTSIYLKDAATGAIRSIAHAGDPAPGGGVYRAAISPVMNNRGDVVFLGNLTPPPSAGQVTGVYLHSHGVTIPVARPGDEMP